MHRIFPSRFFIRKKIIGRTGALIFLAICLLHPSRFSAVHYEFIQTSEIGISLIRQFGPNNAKNPLCSAPNFTLLSEFDSDYYLSESSYVGKSESEIASLLNVTIGGLWRPKECASRYHSVLIIPYRDRKNHLSTFIKYIHPFMQIQRLSYEIYVIEQSEKRPFNRGKLLNIGFLEFVEKKRTLYRETSICLIFHDVDLIPMDTRNLYTCGFAPRHMSVSLDSFRYNLPYESLFGGVVALTDNVFKTVNGFSNRFYGWGGEDDDFFRRIRKCHYSITRFSPEISRYKMLPHDKAVTGDNTFLYEGNSSSDGLSSTKYNMLDNVSRPLYTTLTVDL